MHPYYQQNEERLKRQMNAYLILVRLEIEQIFGKAYDEAFEEIWGIIGRRCSSVVLTLAATGAAARKISQAACFSSRSVSAVKTMAFQRMNGAGWRLRSTSAGLQGCRDRCAELHVFSSGRRRGW